MRPPVLAVPALLVLAVAAAACADPDAGGEQAAHPPAPAATGPAVAAPSPTLAHTPRPTPTPTPTPEPALAAVATVAPVADLVGRVAGDRAVVEALVPAGADSHTYEPRPRDVTLLADADGFFGIGLDLNPGAVRLAEEHLPDGAPVVLLGETALDADLLLEEDHRHSHDNGHAHDVNPHVWTSVRLAMQLVEGAAVALADMDPEGAEAYRDNAGAYLAELRELDEAIAAAVATVPEHARRLVTYHDAWVYFARDYGLEAVTAVQPLDFSEPSAAEVRAVIDLVRAHDVPAIFGSEVFPSDVLDAIAAETGARYMGDLSDDVLPGEPGDPEHSYTELMRRNASRIVAALGGDPGALD